MKYFIQLLLFLLYSVGYSQEPDKNTFLKAAFVEKFARFTVWPDNAIGDKFKITIIGEIDFEDALMKLAKVVKIKGKVVIINHIKDISGLGDCQILIISGDEQDKIKAIVSRVNKLPILLIGDTEGFAEKGVHFNLYYTAKETIHFEVNPVAILMSQLRVDAMLLNYGKKVENYN